MFNIQIGLAPQGHVALNISGAGGCVALNVPMEAQTARDVAAQLLAHARKAEALKAIEQEGAPAPASQPSDPPPLPNGAAATH